MKETIKRMVFFGGVSSIATLLDFVLFRFVFYYVLPLFWAEILASLIGMVLNFFLQKKYVFELKRKSYTAFFLSLLFSLIILFFGGFILTQLTKIELFATYISLAKLSTMGIKFLFNFFSKQWVFEKKLFR